MSEAAIALSDDETLPADLEFDLEMLESTPALSEDEFSRIEPGDDDVMPLDVEFEREMIVAAPQMVVGVQADLRDLPAFRDQLAARVAAGQPMFALERETPRTTRKREFEFGSGQIFGPAGGQTNITLTPQCKFRCEKLMATDDSAQPGMGTAIVQVAVGQRIQRPGNTPQGSLTYFFSNGALANGISFDTGHAWEKIVITVKFLQQCNFSANLFGTAELDEGPGT